MGNRNCFAALGRAGLLACGIAVATCGAAASAYAATTPVTPMSLTFCSGKISADPGAKAVGEPNLLDYSFRATAASPPTPSRRPAAATRRRDDRRLQPVAERARSRRSDPQSHRERHLRGHDAVERDQLQPRHAGGPAQRRLLRRGLGRPRPGLLQALPDARRRRGRQAGRPRGCPRRWWSWSSPTTPAPRTGRSASGLQRRARRSPTLSRTEAEAEAEAERRSQGEGQAKSDVAKHALIDNHPHTSSQVPTNLRERNALRSKFRLTRARALRALIVAIGACWRCRPRPARHHPDRLRLERRAAVHAGAVQGLQQDPSRDSVQVHPGRRQRRRQGRPGGSLAVRDQHPAAAAQ